MILPDLKTRLTTRFKANVPKPTFKCKRLVNSQVLDETTNVVSDKVEYKTVSRSDEMRPYKCSDFSLHNLIAIGAPLNDVKMQSSHLANADNLAVALENIPESAFSNEIPTE